MKVVVTSLPIGVQCYSVGSINTSQTKWRDVFRVKTVVIVTQRYHLYRALYIAERMGLTVYGVACDSGDAGRIRLPDVREILARCKDFFYTIFLPLPTYLGAEIPIAGNGDLTNG